MNLTLHLIRKDLRALRWPLLLWIAACLTHLGLRLAQFARGDAAPLTPFWRAIETTHRWDHTALFILPILIVPLLLHLDPLRGALAFWKTVPISRARLLTAKCFTLAVFFIALPFVCEVVYFVKAGLSVVLATALADWAWRFLPGIAAVVLGCAFTRSLKVGVPGVALALWLATFVFQWPYGRDRIANPLLGSAAPKPPGLIAPPPGSRIEIMPKSVEFARINYGLDMTPGNGTRTEERLAATLRLHASGLPADVLVSSVRLQGANVQLPGRTLEETDDASRPHSIRSSGIFVMSPNMIGPRTGATPGQLPAQEQREEFGSNTGRSTGMEANEWQATSGYFRVAAKEVPAAGVLVEGKVLVSLARKRLIATLPVAEGAQWQPGLHRFTLSDVSPPQATNANFHATLATVLADPLGETGRLALTPASNFSLWIEHASLPLRKRLLTIPSASWRAARNAPNLQFSTDASSTSDITRSRKRTDFAPSFDPIAAMRNGATPLTVARFAEEQAQMRNWHLAIVAYDDLGTIELPLKAVVPRPVLARDESDELQPALPSLGVLLSEIAVPENPNAAAARKAFAQIVEATRNRQDDSIRRHENALLRKLASLGADHLEVLLSAAAEALPAPRGYENPANLRTEWVLPWNDPPLFWRHVIIVACDLARPADKATILRFHSPALDLLRAIEPNGWEADALPGMCRTAATERVPPTWQDCFARHPGLETRTALLAQIRQRAANEHRVAHWIASGVLPAREAAGEMWETAVANTGAIRYLMLPFPIAARHGVEIIPRDLVRILRLQQENFGSNENFPFKARQAGFVQSFSQHSDCPPGLAVGAPWLEENALVVQFDDATGRYELPGKAAPAPDLSAWGDFRNTVGVGRAQVDGRALVLSSAGAFADYWNTPESRTAPRVLREIEGDFTVEVTVAPEFDLARAWGDREDRIFQSAGLLLEAGEQRWIRWEHGLWKAADGHQLREEFFRAGKNIVKQRASDLWDRAKPVRLRLARHGDLFWTAWGQEGGAWVESPAHLELGWPRKIRVGLVVINGVARPLRARASPISRSWRTLCLPRNSRARSRHIPAASRRRQARNSAIGARSKIRTARAFSKWKAARSRSKSRRKAPTTMCSSA